MLLDLSSDLTQYVMTNINLQLSRLKVKTVVCEDGSTFSVVKRSLETLIISYKYIMYGKNAYDCSVGIPNHHLWMFSYPVIAII